MKHLLLTTIAALMLVGCATTQQQEPPTAKAPDIPIHDAAKAGNIEVVKQHIAAGTDVNAKDFIGYTPLHGAAAEGHKEIAELLIANSADLNAQSVGGNTPLDFATPAMNPRASPELADLLRKHGGKTGLENTAKYTNYPLNYL